MNNGKCKEQASTWRPYDTERSIIFNDFEIQFYFILLFFFTFLTRLIFSLSFSILFFLYILYIAAARLSCKNIDDLSVAEHVPDFPFILTIHVWRLLLMLMLRLLSSLLLLYFTIITKVFPNFFYFIFFDCFFFVRFCVQVQIQCRTERRQKKT